MIAYDMPVQIRRCGTTVPVQQLAIGDLIYDPLRDNFTELVDILSRKPAASQNPLVRIRADRITTGRPNRDLKVSRQQIVGYTEKTEPGGCARLQFCAAHLLGERSDETTCLYVLVPERPSCICVAGALLQIADPAVLARQADPLSGGAA